MKTLNKLFLLACLSGLMAACGSSSSGGGGGSASCEHGDRELGAGEHVATIPASVAGVYDFTFHGPVVKGFEAPADEAPYEDGDKVKFEIKEDGTLIIADKITLCDPVLYDPTGGDSPNPAEAIWFDDENGLAYAASSILEEDGGVWEINLSNNVFWTDDEFVPLGQFNDHTPVAE